MLWLKQENGVSRTSVEYDTDGLHYNSFEKSLLKVSWLSVWIMPNAKGIFMIFKEVWHGP